MRCCTPTRRSHGGGSKSFSQRIGPRRSASTCVLRPSSFALRVLGRAALFVQHHVAPNCYHNCCARCKALDPLVARLLHQPESALWNDAGVCGTADAPHFVCTLRHAMRQTLVKEYDPSDVSNVSKSSESRINLGNSLLQTVRTSWLQREGTLSVRTHTHLQPPPSCALCPVFGMPDFCANTVPPFLSSSPGPTHTLSSSPSPYLHTYLPDSPSTNQPTELPACLHTLWALAGAAV
eukprot:3225009-Rhodomonas_salina.4